MATRLQVPDREELADLYWNRFSSCQKTAEHYNVSSSTVHEWLKKLQIPIRPKNAQFKTKIIKGELHKICQGPLHRHGVFLPWGKFIYRKNAVRSQCKDCERFRRGVEENLPYSKYKPWIISIVRRLGKTETSRRLDISYKHMQNLLDNPPEMIRAALARKIVVLLFELRETGEVRHKKSIHYGATERGRKERKTVHQRDLYVPFGDNDRAGRKENRKRNPEQVKKGNRKVSESRRKARAIKIVEEFAHLDINSLDPLELYDALMWIRKKYKYRSVKDAADFFFSQNMDIREVLAESDSFNGNSQKPQT